jgi:hypothetical protein
VLPRHGRSQQFKSARAYHKNQRVLVKLPKPFFAFRRFSKKQVMQSIQNGNERIMLVDEEEDILNSGTTGCWSNIFIFFKNTRKYSIKDLFNSTLIK